MAGQNDTAANGGSGGAPAGGGQAPPDSGTPSGGNSGNPPASAGSGLDRSKLNPLIAGMNEDQMNEVFDTLFAAARGQNSGVPAHAREPEPTAPPTPSNADLREMIDPSSDKFDPEAAINAVILKNYGGLLGDINKRALSGVEMSLRNQFPDYDTYAGDIQSILAGRPATTLSQQDYYAAYYMAKGARATEAEIKERKKPPVTAPPSPSKDETVESDAKLTPTEEEVARIMYRDQADPIAAFRDAKKRAEGGVTKVPGDKK